MALDPTKNFALVTVTGSFTTVSSTIDLVTGGAAKLPNPAVDGAFNLTLWNDTDFKNPADADPTSVEIVRVTLIIGEQLTISRAQEGTTAIESVVGKTFKMLLGPTKKMIDDIETEIAAVGGVGESVTLAVAQTAHGLAVGDVVRSLASGTYTKALADSVSNSDVAGIVTVVTDANNFTMTLSGNIDVAAAVPTATAGTALFLSDTTAGLLTATEPTETEKISKLLAIVTVDNSEMIMNNTRGLIILGNTHSIDLELTSSQFLSVADKADSLHDLNGNMTVEAWINMETVPPIGTLNTVVSKFNDPGQRSWLFGPFDDAGVDKLRFQYSTNGSDNQLADIAFTHTLGTWIHIAATLDIAAGTVELFVDGSSIGTVTGLGTTLFQSTSDFFIGTISGGASNIFDGKIDEVRVWNFIRTPLEIASNRFDQLAGNEPNLVGYWRLNNTLTDEHINGNDLTKNGSPLPSFSTDIPF